MVGWFWLGIGNLQLALLLLACWDIFLASTCGILLMPLRFLLRILESQPHGCQARMLKKISFEDFTN